MIRSYIRNLYHEPFEGMGYRAVKRKWGTYWNTDQVYTENIPHNKVEEFLDDICKYYKHKSVYINVDGREEDASLGKALREAGCKKNSSEIFLVHRGVTPQCPSPDGIEVEPVSESNLIEFSETRLKAFSLIEDTSQTKEIHDEMSIRRSELTGTASGCLARFQGEPAGAFWWYEEQDFIFLSLLGVLPPYRNQGIGQWLISRRVQDAYKEGYQFVILNVLSDNVNAIRLYRRLGFSDEIYWRGRYLFETKK